MGQGTVGIEETYHPALHGVPTCAVVVQPAKPSAPPMHGVPTCAVVVQPAEPSAPPMANAHYY